MNLRHLGWTALAVFAVLAVAGCRKSPPDQPAPPKPSAAAPAPEQTSRLHWLGKQRLAAETKAAGLMSIWNLPESSRLEAQTLDRLALAPWRLLKGDAATNGAPAALLRVVLDDLVREESWLEIRHATNPPGELAFAIRLSDAQAASWETNLATVFESLTGVKPTAAAAGRRGWSLQKAGSPQRLELTRAGEWTLLGLAQERNALLADVRARLERDRVPFAAPATNLWLDADVDLRRIARAFALAWPLPAQWPRLTLTAAAASTNLSLRGQMHFPDPLPFEVEAWNIPTNLIHHPLHSFTAIQGLRSWLGAWKVWQDLQLGDPPNQLFFWAQQQAPALTYGAAPMPKAGHAVSTLATYVLSNAGPWIAAHRMGKLETPADADGLAWTGIPFMAPFVKSVAGPLGDFAYGGLAASTLTSRPPPGVLREFLRQTNLVLYDRELTGPRVEGWLYNSQTLRLMCWRAQFPGESASMKWLQSLAPKLGNSTTLVSKTGPAQLSFTRESSIGLTALEMHVLGDWLESPQFPRGFHTLLARPPAPPRPQREDGTQELRNPASIRPPR